MKPAISHVPKDRLVHVFLVSGMSFVYFKLIPGVWLDFRFLQTHTSNLQGMRFSYPKEEVGMKHRFEESTLFVLFLFLFMSLNSNY